MGLTFNRTSLLTTASLCTLILLTLLYSAMGHVFWWGWPALTILISLSIFRLSVSQLVLTPLSTAIFIYSILMWTNIIFINPAVHIEGIYFVCFFFFSFLLGRSLTLQERNTFLSITISVFCIFSVWAVFQYLTGFGYIIDAGYRANTVYTTPNLYAAAINVLLVPLIIYRFGKSEHKLLDIIIPILFIGLMVSQSRGGWIAFCGGITTGLLLLKITGNLRLNKKTWLLLLNCIIIFTVIVIYHSTEKNLSLVTRTDKTANENIKSTVENTVKFTSIAHRLHFYKIAWQQTKQHPLFGNGYFNYKYFLNRDNSAELARYGTTHFVHNDYLQHLLESGISGLICLLLIIITFYYQAFRLLRDTDKESHQTQLILIVACITGVFIHALGDFLLYVPGIMLFAGLTLGYFDQLCSTKDNLVLHQLPLYPRKTFNLLKSLTLIFIIFSISLPVAARHFSLASDSAYTLKRYTDAFRLIQWAQHLAPYEEQYLYAEARLWLKATRDQQNIEAANKAEELLINAINKNPFEKYLLLERSKLHRDYAHLLEDPVSIDQVLEWQQEVLAWQSKIKNNAAQIEYIKTLQRAGRNREANKMMAEFRQELIQNSRLRGLLNQALKPKQSD